MPRKRRSCSTVQPVTLFDNCSDSCIDSDDATLPPAQRNAANARERARMRVLSKAFCRLKTTLPWVPADTKLSKLDTLRLATSYIAHLRATLNEVDESGENNTHVENHPLNLSWPFTFPYNNAIISSGTDNLHNNHLNSSHHESNNREVRSPVVTSEYNSSNRTNHSLENYSNHRNDCSTNYFIASNSHFNNVQQVSTNGWNSCPTH